ncbi:MAG: hypothetical protein LUD22_00665 [Coprobacillus sp.]|nr:hypothetical protein [Coprobacillus sp.]
MLKQVLETALIIVLADSAFSPDLPGIDGSLPTITDYNFSMEVAAETDFGTYDYDFDKTEFTLPISIGSGYNDWTFTCTAGVYAPKDDGTYDTYPDNGDMGTYTFTVGKDGNEIMHGKTETYEAKFTVGFFKNKDYEREIWEHLYLVFFIDGTAPSDKVIPDDTPTSYTFYSEFILRGFGKYKVKAGTKEFYPIDDHIVFGGTRENGNVTETVDFSSTKDAICEEKYLSINDSFDIAYTATDREYSASPNIIDAWIYVVDPNNYFEYMHSASVDNFAISLDHEKKNSNDYIDKDGNTVQVTGSFWVGGETYWVDPSTLTMSLKQETRFYEETTNFYFKVGYYDLIKENCEFYFVAKDVGYNEATYIIPLNFLGDHDYYGSCLDSDYCMHYGRG